MGRHASKVSRRSAWGERGALGVAAAVVGSLVVAGIGGLAALRSRLSDGCPGGARVLRVAVTPELAPVVARTARSAADGQCWRADVQARPAAEVLDALRHDRRDRRTFDVWVPDSSVWVREAETAGVPFASEAGPVATSPVVLAVPPGTAAVLAADHRSVDLSDVLGTGATARPVRTGWPDPARSAPAVAALLGLEHAADRSRAGRSDLAGLMRSATTGTRPATAARLARGRMAVPVAEQVVWAHDATSTRPVVAVYSSAPGTSLDYPYVVTGGAPDITLDAAGLLAALRGPDARHLLAARGFRDASGRAGAALRAVSGIDAARVAGVATPSVDDVDTARSMIATLDRGSRILAVVDVSGSMADPVPGTGRTRLALTVRAAAAGLGLLPRGSRIGLWEFSTDLTPRTDYRELVRVGALNRGQQARLAAGLAAMRPVPDGSTGLYDTVLAAVRRVRAGYDPTRANAVVVLTDGADQDPHGIGLSGLLDRLRREDDPARPVPVIAVAYGPDGDAASLRAISDVTGGATYVSADLRRIRTVLLDAIGLRLCRPDCADPRRPDPR